MKSCDEPKKEKHKAQSGQTDGPTEAELSRSRSRGLKVIGRRTTGGNKYGPMDSK